MAYAPGEWAVTPTFSTLPAAPEGEPMGLSESAQNPDGTLGHPARPILDIWQKFESGSAFVLESALPEMRRVK